MCVAGGYRMARIVVAVMAIATATCSCEASTSTKSSAPGLSLVVPIPAQVTGDPSTDFTLGKDDAVHAGVGAEAPAQLLAELLQPATGFYLPVQSLASSDRGISLALNTNTDPEIGDQGYRLSVGKAVTITANTTAGLFNGAQTLRQLFGPEIGSDTRQPGPWKVPGGRIVDYPRFTYRGVMLDVARRFRPTADVKRFIDDIARYKINYLQLHLTDDQGWRIQIDKWPNLTDIGARTQVGGGAGGFYSKADYSDIVSYAAARGITVVPAIESPGHSNAALTSYPELNCDGHAPPPRTDTGVGYSSLCVGKDLTYTFLDDVISEIAALTPGPYLQIGADEPDATTPSDYQTYVGKLLPIVAKHNKTPVGWHEITRTPNLPGTTVVQYWGTIGGSNTGYTDQAAATRGIATAAHNGNKILMSPPSHTYLDMKYTPTTQRGLTWAGFVDVDTAYNWDPGTYLPSVDEKSVLGVEAVLWTETITSINDAEYMTFPRLPAIAELGWSPKSTHDWSSFSQRLAAQAGFWTNAGINYYPSPRVAWLTQSKDAAR
jgi:hexosaminidase